MTNKALSLYVLKMKLLFSLTSLLILTFSSFGNGEWLYYKHYPWVWDNMTKDWLYLRGSNDGKIYSYRASTQEWEEFSVPAEESFDLNNQPSTLTVRLNSSVNLDMIWCTPGTFIMGSQDTWWLPSDPIHETQHEVTLTNGFYLGKYEVTQAQYEAVMTGVTGDRNATPSRWHGYPDRPVEKVSWDDAQVFMTRLNAQQAGDLPVGWSYVLPTEAQWEYACRAGTTTLYSWGDDINSSRANYRSLPFGNSEVDFKQTRDVGQYAANPWGFYDMHGNVKEWCADWYAHYPSGSVTDPIGPASGTDRILRGGSWGHSSSGLPSARRSYDTPSYRNSYFYGFRVGLQKSQ